MWTKANRVFLLVLAAATIGVLYLWSRSAPPASRADHEGGTAVVTGGGALVQPDGTGTAKNRVVVRGQCLSLLDWAPISGATVQCGSEVATSQEDGRFELVLGTESPAYLVARAPGFRDISRELPDAGNAIDIGQLLFVASEVLRGTVRTPSGSPAPHARVVLARGSPDEVVATVVADASGRFAFDLAPEKLGAIRSVSPQFLVRAWKEGLSPGVAHVQSVHDEVVVTLVSGAAFSGMVYDYQTRSPIEGAIVRVSELHIDDWLAATTDGEGRFQLDGVGDQSRVVVSAAGYVSGWLMVPDAGHRAGPPVDIALLKAVELTGRVVTAHDRRPVLGARVATTTPEPLRVDGVASPYYPFTYTDSEGRFALGGTPNAGPIELVVYRGAAQALLTFERPPTDFIEIELAEPDWSRMVRVRVLDRRDRPVAGAEVRFVVPNPEPLGTWRSFLAPLPTGNDGRTDVSVHARTMSEAAVLAQKGGLVGVSGQVFDLAEWDGRTITIRLAESGIVRGKIKVPAGASKVQVSLWTTGASGAPIPGLRSRLDRFGRFALRGPVSRNATLVVEGEGITPMLHDFEMSRSGSVIELPPISVLPATETRGRVVSRSKSGISGLNVSFVADLHWRKYLARSAWSVTTGKDGTFVIRGLPPCVRTITVRSSRRSTFRGFARADHRSSDGDVLIVFPVD